MKLSEIKKHKHLITIPKGKMIDSITHYSTEVYIDEQTNIVYFVCDEKYKANNLFGKLTDWDFLEKD